MNLKSEKPFRFKQFVVYQENCSLKVNTDGCLLGAVAALGLPNGIKNPPTKILDIGTGTGVIALMLAQVFKCEIEAVEIDKLSAQQATINFTNSQWAERLNCYHNDIETFSENQSHNYDLIICNPPFFENVTKSPYSHKNISKHNDLLPPDSLLKSVKKLLSAKGEFYIILPVEEAKKFSKLLFSYKLFINYQLEIKPISYKKTHRLILKISFEKQKVLTEELSIRNQDQSFNNYYEKLLSSYYIVF